VWDLYNVILLETIEAYVARTCDSFDCVMLNDVLEHFEIHRGRALLSEIKRLVAPGGTFLVSTPAQFFEQGAVYGNDWETHRSLWTVDDLAAHGFDVQIVGRADFLCGQALFGQWRPPSR
jgi:2-polyprenyl-3-methyl-5-hydroxy-6-metoxy-1,4-benzoquinol methylase